MRRSLLLGTFIASALALVTNTQAQSPSGVIRAGGEYIVSSQVVSDEVVGGSGEVSSGGAVVGNGGAAVGPGVIGRQYGHPDLFYNYYTQGQSNQINAQMYLAPVPVPPWVGHTYYTYQPLMPHEYLYTHHDRYHHHYDYGRGLNRTKISYRPAVGQVARDIYLNFRIPR